MLVVTVLVVVAIALVAVGRVTADLAEEPPPSVFDLDEAVDYVAERLSFEASAQLSYDEVRQVIGWHLDYLEAKGIATEAGEMDVEQADAARESADADAAAADEPPDLPIVADENEGIAYVLGKASDAGIDIDDVRIVEVADATMAYLEAIGAIGTPVERPEA